MRSAVWRGPRPDIKIKSLDSVWATFLRTFLGPCSIDISYIACCKQVFRGLGFFPW